MKIKRFLTVVMALAVANASFAWGPKGHAVIADIASHHISDRVAEKVDKVLMGETMVDVSSWMDGIRKIPKYEHTYTWHFVNVDEGYTYETMPKEPKGDVYTQLNHVVERLKSGTLSAEDQRDYLRYLIHMVGDMHCPMHAGHRSDLGGNTVPVKWFGAPTNLHSIWDSKLVDSCRPWSYSEWTANIDRNLTKEDIARITDPSIRQWMQETLDLCPKIYADTPAEGNYSYDYCDKYTPVVKQQFLKGGLRLAKLLNEIYGE